MGRIDSTCMESAPAAIELLAVAEVEHRWQSIHPFVPSIRHLRQWIRFKCDIIGAIEATGIGLIANGNRV